MRGDYARHYARGHFIMCAIMHVVVARQRPVTEIMHVEEPVFFNARDYARCLSEVIVHR